jgi:hypothetical protein
LFWCGRDETQPTLHNLFAAPDWVQEGEMIFLFPFATVILAIMAVVAFLTMLLNSSLKTDERVGFCCVSAFFFLATWLMTTGGDFYLEHSVLQEPVPVEAEK